MTQKLPDIDDLLEGINDPDADSETPPVSQEDMKHEDMAESNEAKEFSDEENDVSPDCWKEFIILTEDSGKDSEKEIRLVCKIDRDLADTLDDCDINGLCRSDLVNNIVRAFLKSYLDRMVKFKKEKKSLFQKASKA